MIRNIIVAISTILLFAALAWTTIAAAPSSVQQQAILQTQVDYSLPYAGILPDSPFYIFKVIRDRIVSFFITDAKKQAEFDLLQADKRLAAGQGLLLERNPDKALVSQTVSKGENYFDEAIKNIAVAKKEGQFVNDSLYNLQQAGIKHEQALLQMAGQTTGKLHADLLNEVGRQQEFENQVNKLKSKQ